jgi:hypothetical protein
VQIRKGRINKNALDRRPMLNPGEPEPLIRPGDFNVPPPEPFSRGIVCDVPLAGLLNHPEVADQPFKSLEDVHHVRTQRLTNKDAEDNFFGCWIDREGADFWLWKA